MKSLGSCNLSTLGAFQRPAQPGRSRSVDHLSIPMIEHEITSLLIADIDPPEVDVADTKYGSIRAIRHHRGIVARLFSLVSLLLLTSPTAFASNLILDPGESGTLAPKPFMGGHGFRFEFAEQTGMFIIEDLNSSGAAQTVAMLDFDGTILGEPSWIIKFATSSGLFNLNEALGNLVLPPGVGPDGTVDSAHNETSSGSIWSWDAITVTQDGGGSWVNVPGGIFHTSSAPPFPTDPPSLVSFTNQTGGQVDIHSLVPEPSTLIISLLASAVLLCRGRRGVEKGGILDR